MVILLHGAATELGEAIASCARNERCCRTVSSGDAASCDAVIQCTEPDAVRDPDLVNETLARLAGTAKPFVYTSTTWVIGSTRGRLAGEAFPLRPPPEFAWLPAVERELLDTTVRGLRGIVIRPAVIHSGASGLVERLAFGAVPLSPEADASQHGFIHLADLAQLYLLAVEGAPPGSLYVAADGPSHTWGELAPRLGNAVRRTSLADLMTLDQRIGSTRAGRELGWTPSRPTVAAAAHA